MKTTAYFDFVRNREDRRAIRDEWILAAVCSPIRRENQPDGRMRVWGRVDDAQGRILRVVLLSDGETVHNAFFDRSFKGADV